MNSPKLRCTLLVALCLLWLRGGWSADLPAPRDPIVGEWIIHNVQKIEINEDGTARFKTGMRGVWHYLKSPAVERNYEIIWDQGVFIDRFRLSADAKTLEGKDKTGKRIHAERALEGGK